MRWLLLGMGCVAVWLLSWLVLDELGVAVHLLLVAAAVFLAWALLRHRIPGKRP